MSHRNLLQICVHLSALSILPLASDYHLLIYIADFLGFIFGNIEVRIRNVLVEVSLFK